MTTAERTAREMLATAESVPADRNHHPNWDDASVAAVLRPLLDEHERIRAALEEALDGWQGQCDMLPPKRIAELRKEFWL